MHRPWSLSAINGYISAVQMAERATFGTNNSHPPLPSDWHPSGCRSDGHLFVSMLLQDNGQFSIVRYRPGAVIMMSLAKPGGTSRATHVRWGQPPQGLYSSTLTSTASPLEMQTLRHKIEKPCLNKFTEDHFLHSEISVKIRFCTHNVHFFRRYKTMRLGLQ